MTPGAKPAGCVGVGGVAGGADDPRSHFLQTFFQRGEVLDFRDWARADRDLGFAIQDRLDELGNVLGIVLVVRIRVDDHVCAVAQAGVQACHESPGKSLVCTKIDDMIDPVRPGYFHRAIRRSVVNDQPLDLIDAGDLPWKRLEGNRKRALFVVARHLDDELLHGEGRCSLSATS